MGRALQGEQEGSRGSGETHKPDLIHTSKLCHSVLLSWAIKQMFFYIHLRSLLGIDLEVPVPLPIGSKLGRGNGLCPWPFQISYPCVSTSPKAAHRPGNYRFPSCLASSCLTNGMHQGVWGWGEREVVSVGCVLCPFNEEYSSYQAISHSSSPGAPPLVPRGLRAPLWCQPWETAPPCTGFL